MWYIAKERVESRGFIFIGLYGDYKGSKTKVKMMEPKTGKTSVTVTINNLNKIKGFPLSRYERTSKSNRMTVVQAQQKLDCYSSDRKVFRDDKESLRISCSVCKEKGFKGVYELFTWQLNRRVYPCSCNKYAIKPEDKITKVKGKCKNLGYTYLGVDEKDKVKFRCSNGHLSDKLSLPSFLSLPYIGCRQCYLDSKKWNYFPCRKYEDDNLYLLEVKYRGNWFYKIGKAFNIEKRVSAIKRRCKVDIVVVDFIRSYHKNIITLEARSHRDLDEYKAPQPFEGGTEIFYLKKEVKDYFNKIKEENNGTTISSSNTYAN